MQLDYLRYFIALSEYQSITKTSQMLNTTPQNVSRILKKIEATMEVELYKRNNEGIQLTKAGEAFLNFAKSTIYAYDEMASVFKMQPSDPQSRPEVTLYSKNVINDIILNDILIAFSKRFPDIILNNFTVDWEEGYDKLNDHPNALAFLNYYPEFNHLDNHLFTPVIALSCCAIVQRDHPLAKKGVCTNKDLLNYSLILHVEGDLAKTEIGMHIHLEPDLANATILSFSNATACYQMAADTNHVFIGMRESFERQPQAMRDKLTLLPIIDWPARQYGLIKPKSLPSNAPEQLLYTFILNYIQKYKLAHDVPQ